MKDTLCIPPTISEIPQSQNDIKYSFENFQLILAEAKTYCVVERGDVVVRWVDLYNVSTELEEVNKGIEKLNWMLNSTIEKSDGTYEFIDEIGKPETRYALHVAVEKLNNRSIELQKIIWAFMDNRFDWDSQQDTATVQKES